MKKKLTIAALSSVLVLGMASAAMAIHTTAPSETEVVAKAGTKITIDGAVRVRGLIDKNNASKDTPATTAYDGRVRLGVKAQVSPQATGYIQLETNQNQGDTYNWGTNGAAGLNQGGTKNATTATGLTLLQAWVNYQPGNWGVKAGHMPLALGNMMFFDHTGSGDDALVGYINPNDSTHIAGLLIKFDEQTTSDGSDDLDGYVALITHKYNDDLSVGANWTYLVGGSDDSTGTAELAQGMSMSNIGLNADYKMGNLSFMSDLELQFGDVSDNGTTTTDANGWALKLGATMDLGSAKVGLLYGTGSGDDNAADNDRDDYINFLTDTNYDTLIANYRANVPGTTNFTGGDSNQNSGLSNMSLYQINASTSFNCPLTGKDVDMKAALSYMQLNEDLLFYATGSTNQISATARAGEDEVGTELDLITTWHLTPGLDYKIEAAWMATGDVYQQSAGDDPDDLYFLRHRLELKF